MPPKRKPKAGDPVEVSWLDITGSDSGRPTLAQCRSRGYFCGYEQLAGRRCLVTHRSVGMGEDYDTGWDAFPASIVVKVRVL